jgi:hypothetical protein
MKTLSTIAPPPRAGYRFDADDPPVKVQFETRFLTESCGKRIVL